MESVKDHIEKARAERKAREKARIEKLRELNLKKYNNNQQPALRNTNLPTVMKPVKNLSSMKSNESRTVKYKQLNQAIQRKGSLIPKIQNVQNTFRSESKLPFNMNNRKSIAIDKKVSQQSGSAPSTSRETLSSRKSVLPGPSQTANRKSVFERLYKPKMQVTTQIDNVGKMPTNPKCLKRNVPATNVLCNKRFTTFDAKTKDRPPIRRSISAVHFKRIDKSELGNCIHKYASIGDKIDSIHLKEINEDETVNHDKVVSAVKSERKKVKFMTPMSKSYSTPRPDEMQVRLKAWLQKHGKSFDSYHHLQCFGIKHMAENTRQFDIDGPSKVEFSDDEDKENIAVESDSDDGSYVENMNGGKRNKHFDGWRKASRISESFELNESGNTTITSAVTPSGPKDVLFGALTDLTDLLKEGFEWEQCARWLRAIRERFPSAIDTAPYWECRAALEEHRGNLGASMECWEQAIVKGAERSVVETNLDQLLDKFMQLRISPNSGQRRQVDPKLVDMKNVFKSTIIRFAVQQGKSGQSNQYTVTPVRRSGRLSTQAVKRTPFTDRPAFKQFPQEATTIKQLEETIGESLQFVPNATLCRSP